MRTLFRCWNSNPRKKWILLFSTKNCRLTTTAEIANIININCLIRLAAYQLELVILSSPGPHRMTECKYNCLIASSAALTKFLIFTTYQLTFANFSIFFPASDGLLMLVLEITMNSPLSWCGDHDQKFYFCLSVIKPARLSVLLSMLIKRVLFVTTMLCGVIFIIDTKIRYYSRVCAAIKTTTSPGIRQETHSVRGMNAQKGQLSIDASVHEHHHRPCKGETFHEIIQ